MVIRAARSGSRCSACGRFGHEQGDPECVHASGGQALPAPIDSPDDDDVDQASESEMQAIVREIASYVDPPTTGPVKPDASDVPVTGSDEELQEVDDSRISVEERRRKVEGGYPDTPKRQKYEDQRTGASKVAQFVLNEVLTSGPTGR